MIVYGVHVRSAAVAAGVDEDDLLALAEVAAKLQRISDVVVSGGGDPPAIDLRFCVEAVDHVAAARTGVKAFKDVVRNVGIPGVEIERVAVEPDPWPGDDTEDLAELAAAAR
jgi:hypothetical protein